jgi:hypothetical protein
LSVEVEKGLSVKHCKGHIISINGPRTFKGDLFPLTFAPAKAKDSMDKTIVSGKRQLLDVITISSENLIRPHTKDFEFPNHFSPRDFFSTCGDYIIEIGVDYNEEINQSCKLELKWRGDWKTAEMTMI